MTKLTANRARFVDEYLIDLNATQAAVRAGYSQRSARMQGQRLLTNDDIQSAIAVAMHARAERTHVTQDRVLLELARLAFSDIRRAIRWNAAGIELVNRTELDDETGPAIAEIAQIATAHGVNVQVRMYDKLGALVTLGRHLGMFTAHPELDTELRRMEVCRRQAELDRLRANRSGTDNNDLITAFLTVISADAPLPVGPIL